MYDLTMLKKDEAIWKAREDQKKAEAETIQTAIFEPAKYPGSDAISKVEKRKLLQQELEAFLSEKLIYNQLGQLDVLPPKTQPSTMQPFPQEMLNRLGLTQTKCFNRFVKPWIYLEPHDIRLMIEHWLPYIRTRCPLEIKLLQPLSDFQALEWTVSQAILLCPKDIVLPSYHKQKTIPKNLVEIVFPTTAHATPLYQCCYCGRLDRDLHGRAFNGKTKFCHLGNCNTLDSDYNQHDASCCLREWRQMTKLFNLNWSNNRNNPDRQRALFRAFCDERYEKNHALLTPLRAKVSSDRSMYRPKTKYLTDKIPCLREKDI